MQNQPLVSVIIPTYGRADLISRAINSVLNQSYKNIEIIVINDNPKEAMAYTETIQKLSKYDELYKVRVISDGINSGGAEARNKGIGASKGEYITFLDDDDYYYPEKIQKQISKLLTDNLDVCVCGMDIDNDKKITQSALSYPKIGSIQDFILEGNCYTPMILAKRYVFEEIKGFSNVKRFQDHILMLKILKKGIKVGELNEFLFVHNNHNDPRITKNTLYSFSDRWSFEEDLIFLLNKKQKKIYWFKRNIITSIFSENVILLILNYRNVTCFKDFLINSKKISLILFKKIKF